MHPNSLRARAYSADYAEQRETTEFFLSTTTVGPRRLQQTTLVVSRCTVSTHYQTSVCVQKRIVPLSCSGTKL